MTHDILCLKCEGSGIDHAKANAMPGRLMPLCPGCLGSGVFSLKSPAPAYRAVFLVGSRFIVRITMPQRTGGFVEMDCDWSPRLPPATGKGKLRPSERRDYEAGRDAAMREHHAQMGGKGGISLLSAEGRH
jgi:hypothetical protein